jgi:hypothetical protein
MTMNSMFEQDADALKVADDDIVSIAGLAKRAKLLEKEVEEMESVVKERKDQLRKLVEEVIPEALAGMGMKSFKMEDGSSIDVKPFYSASISEARRAEAYQWLRDHGFDDIIKNTVSVRFGRGEDELCSRLIGLLDEKGFPASQTEKIEPMTLKAWVKEQTERGNEFPSELFGAYIGQKAIIKSA